MSKQEDKKPLMGGDDEGYGEEYEYTMPLAGGGDYDEYDDGSESFAKLKPSLRKEALAAERLSVRLLAIDDDDEEAEDQILRESLALTKPLSAPPPSSEMVGGPFGMSNRVPSVGRIPSGGSLTRVSSVGGGGISLRPSFASTSKLQGFVFLDEDTEPPEEKARRRVCTMVMLAVAGIALVCTALFVGVKYVGPPNQPVGPYQLVERQEGLNFFDYYTFYEGRDSVGSNGYNMYVGMQKAQESGIVNVTMETDVLDVYRADEEAKEEQITAERNKARAKSKESTSGTSSSGSGTADDDTDGQRRLQSQPDASSEAAAAASAATTSTIKSKTEPFIYMGSKATAAGPRDSIRLEGIRRFDRGLFIIDIRHMPAGCGVWPAFWLTDEANWPINGEIDIVEGVNYQSEAKTALHSTNGCSMNDIPLGTMTGKWDTAQGIPDAKTGIPDMTLRYARDCFVYNPHQWLNQGCVAVDKRNDTLGVPLNKNGGGVYALEWDPAHRRIRTWVFTPHASVPDNLMDAIRTAGRPEEDRIMPDPDEWPLPYGYFAIGEGTDCPASHFRHMRLVFNLAFCGSVAGNRYFMDCPNQFKQFKTCNEWVKSDPDELKEAYWKIRGVYVYERKWERAWIP